jgi:phenylalanyl-tRNA synthetase beta chain
MRVPLSWLREYVAVELPVAELAHRLTMAGVEVGSWETVGEDWRNVLVGRIAELSRHARNPAWNVASVDLGGRTTTLVTTATNLQVGDVVPVVQPGGALPGGMAVEAKTFDGVTSEGMLCSGYELGVDDDRGGIYVLEPEAPLGADLASYLDDVVLDVDLTPNRPDLLGIIGVAREVSAITGAPLRVLEPPVPVGPTPADQLVSVVIEAPDLCPRYSATVMQGVRIGPSPPWLRRRLHWCGVRAISNVVDVTNYVMLELGQPLHAFDGARLRGGIHVRRARPGERIRTIDEVERELSPEMLVIADEAGPIAVAGVMGGGDSEVSAATTHIVLESAHFDPRSVRRTSRALRLASEASRRFDKGVDPEGTVRAAQRATQLILQLAGGQAAAGQVDVYPTPEPPREISLTTEAVDGLLGQSYSEATIVATLSSLGFGVEGHGTLTVRVPSWRPDVECRADLAEEVARIQGYDAIPTTLPAGALPPPRPDPTRAFVARTKAALVGAGYQEVISYSLVDGAQNQRLDSEAPWPAPPSGEGMIQLYNYMSVDRAYLRTTLLGSLLETLAANLRHRDRVYLFELARVYLPPLAPLPTEVTRLGIVFHGPREPASWAMPPTPGDFFDLKGVVEAVLDALRIPGPRYGPGRHPAFHPGRTATVRAADGTSLGVFGQVHPLVAERFDLENREVYAAELDFEALLRCASDEPSVTALPRYPGVAVDLAAVVDEAVPEADVAAAIRDAGAPLLAELRLFDVYRGAPVPAGRKSLAYALVYRAPDRTLTDEDTAAAQARIEGALRERFGATIRGR